MAGILMSLLTILSLRLGFLIWKLGLVKSQSCRFKSKRVTIVWKHRAQSSCPVSFLFTQGGWDNMVMKGDVSGFWSPL